MSSWFGASESSSETFNPSAGSLLQIENRAESGDQNLHFVTAKEVQELQKTSEKFGQDKNDNTSAELRVVNDQTSKNDPVHYESALLSDVRSNQPDNKQLPKRESRKMVTPDNSCVDCRLYWENWCRQYFYNFSRCYNEKIHYYCSECIN